jgi:hypothetical protein
MINSAGDSAKDTNLKCPSDCTQATPRKENLTKNSNYPIDMRQAFGLNENLNFLSQ